VKEELKKSAWGNKNAVSHTEGDEHAFLEIKLGGGTFKEGAESYGKDVGEKKRL